MLIQVFEDLFIPIQSQVPWLINSSALVFFFSSRRRHTRLVSDWSSDVCSSDLRCSCRRARARHEECWGTANSPPGLPVDALFLARRAATLPARLLAGPWPAGPRPRACDRQAAARAIHFLSVLRRRGELPRSGLVRAKIPAKPCD